MASDLTGLVAIVVLAGGAYIVLSSDWAKQNLNGNNTTDAVADTGTDEPGNTNGGTGKATVDCGKLCRLKDCKKYKKSCKNGCTYCCDSGPKSPSCGSTSGGSSSSTDVSKCKQCGNNQYRQVTASGKCECLPIGGSSGGGSGGKKCEVTKCPSCGSYPNYRICKNNNTQCGCAKVVCKYSNSSQCPSCKPGQGKKLSNCKCSCTGTPSPIGGGGGTGSSCTSCRGGLCKGLNGATCTACCSAGLAKLSYRAYHARPNLRTKYRFSGM